MNDGMTTMVSHLLFALLLAATAPFSTKAFRPRYSSSFAALLQNYGTVRVPARPAAKTLGALIRDNDPDREEGPGGLVSVSVQRKLPHATPQRARDAWIERHWEKGGGLPILVVSERPGGGGQVEASETATRDETTLARTIFPVLMKEEMHCSKTTGSWSGEPVVISYRVTDNGPFFADVIPGSHSATVSFGDISSDGRDGEITGCLMTWNVTFATSRWAAFYESVTKWTVGTAANTIQESLNTPRLLSLTTTIDGKNSILDPMSARKECLDLFFANAGHLPFILSIPYGDILPEGGGAARTNVLYLPDFLRERIVSISSSEDEAEFTYEIIDPGWLTFPFLLHSHFGRVRFSSISSLEDPQLAISWDVEIRPYKYTTPIVGKFLEMVVSTILRNCRVRLTEPGSLVALKPPRGNKSLLFGREILGTIPKETWFGGVLEAHLEDNRSLWEQSLSILQPWTWGRMGSGDENDCIQIKWSDGYMPLNCK